SLNVYCLRIASLSSVQPFNDLSRPSASSSVSFIASPSTDSRLPPSRHVVDRAHSCGTAWVATKTRRTIFFLNVRTRRRRDIPLRALVTAPYFPCYSGLRALTSSRRTRADSTASRDSFCISNGLGPSLGLANTLPAIVR